MEPKKKQQKLGKSWKENHVIGKTKVVVQMILQDGQTLVDNLIDDFTEPLIDPGNSRFH